jgi:hypothetical protein
VEEDQGIVQVVSFEKEDDNQIKQRSAPGGIFSRISASM